MQGIAPAQGPHRKVRTIQTPEADPPRLAGAG